MTATAPELPRLTALRYVQPLREGGSLPAVVDTDGGLFVVKFRGAGQGPKALLAELISGMLATVLDLPVPELARVEVPDSFGRSEPDPEIQDILRASHGVNVGLRYLDGAFNFARAAAGHLVSAELASRVVWFDALLTNPDRTDRNANLLVHERRIWMIDHGAALYAHHDWARVDEARARSAFPLIRDHVLLPLAEGIEEADAALAPRLTEAAVDGALRRLPDELLAEGPGSDGDAEGARERYRGYLRERLRAPRAWVAEAVEARLRRLAEPPRHLPSRR